jgi:hypothetical protein
VFTSEEFAPHSSEWKDIRGDTVNWLTKESMIDDCDLETNEVCYPRNKITWGSCTYTAFCEAWQTSCKSFLNLKVHLHFYAYLPKDSNLMVPQQCQLACYDPHSPVVPRYAAHRDGDTRSVFETGFLGTLVLSSL